jgi:hypothetical protein
MEEVLKNKWIEMLESGEYQQTEGQLRAKCTDAYCCLGVLCLAAELPISESGEYVKDKEEQGYSVLVPLGLSNMDIRTLYLMNDINHKSFKEIASYIRENI